MRFLKSFCLSAIAFGAMFAQAGCGSSNKNASAEPAYFYRVQGDQVVVHSPVGDRTIQVDFSKVPAGASTTVTAVNAAPGSDQKGKIVIVYTNTEVKSVTYDNETVPLAK
jgi:hypothetical protein